jgi:hypothetical protein
MQYAWLPQSAYSGNLQIYSIRGKWQNRKGEMLFINIKKSVVLLFLNSRQKLKYGFYFIK